MQERESTSQKKSLLNSEKSLFVPQENFGIKGQGCKYPTIHCPFEVDDTQEIQERKRDLLRCRPCNHFL
jgi:hypothetical protein